MRSTTNPRSIRVALLAALLSAGLFAGSAHAAAPANDNLAAAMALDNSNDSWSIYANNVDATREAGEPTHANVSSGHSVWFRWTAPSSGKVRFDTCQASFPALLAVYTGGSINTLLYKASSYYSPECGQNSTRSSVTFAAEVGVQYRIAVDGVNYTQGEFRLRLNGPPNNDDFEDRRQIARGENVFGANVAASKEAGEPNHAGNTGGHSTWFSWNAEQSGPVIFETCGSDFNTLLGVYTGFGVGALNAVASSDDASNCFPAGSGSRVTFNATANSTYKLAIDGKNGAIGTYKLYSSPRNDHFAGAAHSNATTGNWYGTTALATKEAGEPQHAGAPGATSTVWYAWKAPFSGRVELNTCGAVNDTVLAVYTGATMPGLSLVAQNDDTAGCMHPKASAVSFDAAEGTLYRIAVGTIGAQTSFHLNVNPPANDDYAAAAPLTGRLPLSTTVVPLAASREATDPNPEDTGDRTVWWTWTAPADGTATIDTCGSEDETQLAVYTGDVPALSRLAFAEENTGCGSPYNQNQSSVTLPVSAGTTYRIMAVSYGEELKLNIQAPNAPDATPITPPAAGGGPGAGEATLATLTVKDAQRLSNLLAGRVRPRVACTRACKLSAKLTVAAKTARKLGLRGSARTIASGRAQLTQAGSVSVAVKVSRKLRTGLRKLGRLSARLTITATDASGAKTNLARTLRFR